MIIEINSTELIFSIYELVLELNKNGSWTIIKSLKNNVFSVDSKIEKFNLASKIEYSDKATIYIYSKLLNIKKWNFEFYIQFQGSQRATRLYLIDANSVYLLGINITKIISEYFPFLNIEVFNDFDTIQENNISNFTQNLSKISPKERIRWYKSLTKKNPSKKRKFNINANIETKSKRRLPR